MLNWVLGQVTSVNKMFVFDLTSLCCSDSDKAFAERKEEMMSIRRRSESVLEYKEHAHGRLQEELLLAQQVRTLAERMRGHVRFVLVRECSVAVFFVGERDCKVIVHEYRSALAADDFSCKISGNV